MGNKILELNQNRAEFLDIIERAKVAYTDAKYYQEDGYWRVFSSAADRQLWESDHETYKNLVKWEFEGKTPRILVVSGLIDVKYILKGTSNNTLDYSFWIEENDGSINHESISVTYTFENEGNIQSVTSIYAGNTQVSFNLDRYLRGGTNTITMQMKSRSTGTVKNVIITYYLIELELYSDFDVAKAITQGNPITVNYLTKSAYPRTVHFLVDGVEKSTVTISASDTSQAYRQQQIINDYNAGEHTLQLYASMVIGEQTFVTKTLYYSFIISNVSVNQTKVTLALTLDEGTIVPANNKPVINAIQYRSITIPWGYYSSNILTRSANVIWKLIPTNGGTEQIINTITAYTIENINDRGPEPLTFVPSNVGNFYLRATIIRDGEEIVLTQYDFNSTQNPDGIYENVNRLMLKLQALGRNNDEPITTRASWIYKNNFNTISTVFSNLDWNAQSGWYENALVLTGDSRAEIQYQPFKSDNSDIYSPQVSGCTVEIEFEIFNVADESASVITIGDMFGKIDIKATSATLTSREGAQVKTNYKIGERIKLCFIIKPNTEDVERRLLYIINNGVLERSNVYSTTDSFNTDGTIQIGNNDAGIRIYNIRCYHTALSINDAWNNSVIDDLSNIGERLEDNDVYVNNSNVLSVSKVSTKIPTMLLTGDVDILIAASNKTTVVLDAQWINPNDPTKNFTLKTANFRNHGQSTLGMPVPSMKFWSDKDSAEMYNVDGNRIIGGRYAFKDGAMPMKKWVLQANYMDSTGCHNGSILRLMNSTWENANVGNQGYALRTPPQNVMLDTYPSYNDGNPSPYKVRTAADSMPCVVFWRKNEEAEWSFLGQYVLMDDKKSDYLYGERSIYAIKDDPFAFFTSKTGATKLWDNKDTLRFEILRNNTALTKFKDASTFWDLASDDDEFSEYEDYGIGDKVRYNNLNYVFIRDHDHGSWNYQDVERYTPGSGEDESNTWVWENSFEMIYPDADDLTRAEYTANANKLYSFVEWLCSTYAVDNGGSGSKAKFQSEVGAHMDIYKVAAYYIFMMRFGLVDNAVRNVQLKTYDGDKWWLEAWDCDIANGNRNDGHLVFGPRIDRNTIDPDNQNAYAFAGHDCWLWNAFESWTYWTSTIVPTVATALFNAGLNYNTVIQMMDTNYCEQWCEKIYNESGKFKYIDQYLGGRSAGFLFYLRGRGESHRHWWLKSNFDFYDAKWCVGDYTANPVYFRCVDGTPAGLTMSFTAAETNYFGWALTSTIQESGVYIQRGNNFSFTNTDGLSVNDPINLFAAPSIATADFSEFARYLNGTMFLEAFNDSVNGTYLTSLNIGIPDADLNNGVRNTTQMSSINISGFEVLTRLATLNIQGWRNLTSLNLTNCVSLKNLKAFGSGLITLNCAEGTKFTSLELPHTITSLDLNGVSWDSIAFKNSDTLASIDVPTGLTTISFRNMGNDVNVRDFIEDWADTMASDTTALSHCSITVSNINWTDVSLETLLTIAQIPRAQRNLTGYIKVTGILTNEDISTLINAYGSSIFNLNAPLIIDAVGGFLMSAPSELLSGESAQVEVVAFPLTNSALEITYQVGYFDGVEWIYPASNMFKNVSLSSTGLLVTNESGYATHTIKVRCIVPGLDPAEQEIVVTARTYPTSVSIEGETYISDPSNFTGLHEYNVVPDLRDTNGSVVNFAWGFADETAVSLQSSTINQAIIRVNELISGVVEKTLQYSVTYTNGVTLTATKRIVLHTRVAVMTYYDNPGLYNIFAEAGYAGTVTNNIMYDIETWEVPNLQCLVDATQAQKDDVVKFDEFNSFTQVTVLDLTNYVNLGTGGLKKIPATAINLYSVKLTNSAVPKIELKNNSQLHDIEYSPVTEEVNLINQSSLVTVKIPEVAADTLEKLIIENCNNLEEITWI